MANQETVPSTSSLPTLGHLAEYSESLLSRVFDGVTFLTTSLVIVEMHGVLVRRRGAESGLALLDVARADPSFDVVRADASLEAAAIDHWLRRHPDLPLSLTDAVSFEVMRDRGLRDALTLDRHFAKAGFRMLPA